MTVMPIYEYECSSCKFYVEALQKISDQPMLKCPSCGKDSLQRLVSAPNFRLKGGGWYETDFKSDKENKRNIAGTEDKPVETKEGDDKDTKTVKKPRKTQATNKKGGKVTAASKKSAKKKPKSVVKKPGKTKAKAVKKTAAKKKSKKSVRKK